MSNLNLLPCPRSLKLLHGAFTLPKQKPLAVERVDGVGDSADVFAHWEMT